MVRTFAIALLCVLLVRCAFAQGCSDAGLCTLPVLKPNPDSVLTDASPANRVLIGSTYGQGNHEITVFTPYIGYEHMLSRNFGASARVTFTAADGELGSHSGLGDLFLNGIYQAGGQTSFTLGVKVPLSTPDAAANSVILPMDYQSSLGTLDLLAGISHSHDAFAFSAGWQQPLTAEVESAFGKYTRQADALLRVSYDFTTADGRLHIRPSLLPIYHIADDTFIDANGIERSIEGSQGWTLNGNLALTYLMTHVSAIEVSLGTPFVSRDARPDGLTRAFVVGLEYRRSFRN